MALTSDQLRAIRELMSDRGCFDVLAALRGPDSGESQLKTFTTAVIRSLLGVSTNIVVVHEPARAKTMWKMLLEEQKKNVTIDWHTQHHFREHFIRALFAIGTPEALEYGQWLESTIQVPVSTLMAIFEERNARNAIGSRQDASHP